MDQVEQDFALLAAFHDTELGLEEARDQLLSTHHPRFSQDGRFLKLRLLHVQQKLARLTKQQPEDIPAKLWDLHNHLVRQVDTREFQTRGILLEASSSAKGGEKRMKLFNELMNGVSLLSAPSTAASSPAQQQSIGHCKNGHALKHFETPTANFTCDQCNIRVPQDVPMYGCRECDFDVCSSCFGGNALEKNAVRPSMHFASIIKEVLTNVSMDRENVFNRLTEHSMGILFSLTACGLFQANLASQEEADLSQHCSTIFAPSTIKGRLNLRALCEAMTPNSALIALSRFAEDDCILRLILCDLQSGNTAEDRNDGLTSIAFSFGHDSPFLRHLTSLQLMRLGALEKSIVSQDWFAQALLERVLPRKDEVDADEFQSTASVEAKFLLISKLKQVGDSLAKQHTALDFLLLHHLVKLDRERRQPLLPNSLSLQHAAPLLSGEAFKMFRTFQEDAASHQQTNLPLLLEYLQVTHRPLIMASKPATDASVITVDDVHSDPLCYVLQQYFPIPSKQEDLELITSEMLDLFAWKDATEDTFLPWLSSQFVHSVYERSTKPSKEEPSIAFCDFNPASFSASVPFVDLTCDFANVRQVYCKVFEIDATRLLRKTQKPVSADINLDGLVAHREFEIQLGGSTGMQRERIRVLDGNRVGCFVVEIVGHGIATRAVIQRGAIRAIETREPFGHCFLPFELDPSAKMATENVELWVDGKVYLPEEGTGRIIVPYASQKDGSYKYTAVLTSGDNGSGARNHLFSFMRQTMQYELKATMFIDRESLVEGNRQAQVLVDASLYIAGEPAPLSLLSEVKLTVTQTDDLEVSTEQVFTQPTWDTNALVKQFKVIPNLRNISCTLSAKPSKLAEITCSDVLNMQVNTCTDPLSVSMRPKTTGQQYHYELVVLGKTGEVVEDFPLAVNFFHESSKGKVAWVCNSDVNGVVDLGNLSQVNYVEVLHTVNKQARMSRFDVPKSMVSRTKTPTVVMASENDICQYIFPLAEKHLELTGRKFALVDLRTKHHLFASHLSLSPQGTHVYVSNLKPGNYRFHYFSPREHVQVEIAVSASVSLLSRDGVLRLPLAGNSRVFAAKPKQHAVTIGTAKLENDQVSVHVHGGSTKKRRVHAVFRTFIVRNDQPKLTPSNSNRHMVFQPQPEWCHLDSALYVSMRKLNEEIVYCMDRLKLKKTSGNMLPPPSLLMNPVDMGVTVSNIVNAREGDVMPQARMMSSMCAAENERDDLCGGLEYRMKKKKSSANYFGASRVMPTVSDPSLDFLSSPSSVVMNLIPHADSGLVTFPIPANCTWVEIVAMDGEDFATQSLFVASQLDQFKDLRHTLNGMELEDHIVETQVAVTLAPQQQFVVGNPSTAKFAVLDTFELHFSFCKSAVTRHVSAQLDSFTKLMCAWPMLTADEKLALYSSKACHEVNFFLKQRDQEFFNTVIRPQLVDKPEHMFVERILLDEDVSALAERMDLVMQMQTMERAMLAVALHETHYEFSQAMLRQLKDLFHAQPQDQVETNRSRLFQVAIQLDKSNASADAALDRMAGVPAPAMFAAAAPQMAAMAQPASLGAREVQFRNSAMNEEESDDSDDKDDTDDGGVDIVDRIMQSQALADEAKYTETGPAHQWCETQFFNNARLVCCDMNALFWYDWAQSRINNNNAKFTSTDFCLAEHTPLSEALFMLGAIQVPYVMEQEHVFTEQSFTPSTACVVFHQQTNKIDQQQQGVEQGQVLIGQRLFDNQEFSNDLEREPMEICKNRVYVSRTVITNVSSTVCRAKLLLQIPTGSVPLDGRASETVAITLDPFSTMQHLSARFYFPQKLESATWFPAHVSMSGSLVAFAQPRRFEVRSQPSRVDETSWVHVSSPTATIDQVVAFLSEPGNKFDLKDICWRFHRSKEDWLRVVECLDKRGIVSQHVLAFALVYGDEKRAALALQLQFANQVGPRFDSQYVSVVQQQQDMSVWLPEVFPLIHARTHMLVSQNETTNVVVNKSHERMVNDLCYNAKPLSDAWRLRVAVLLIEEKKIDLAKRVMQHFEAGKHACTVQAEYLRVYLSFFVDEDHADEVQATAAKNLEIAERYATYPNPRWRERFQAVATACRTVLCLNEPQQQQQADGAAVKASDAAFEIEFEEDGALYISTSHIPDNALLEIKVFKTNVEYLFSTKPFSMLQQSTEQFILPNYSTKVTKAEQQQRVGSDDFLVKLPSEVVENQNVLVQVTYKTLRRVATRFTCAMKVTFMEQRGVLRCLEKKTYRPIGLAYCKVYACMQDGSVSFYKDGYTDICGEMDYCSLNTGSLRQVQEFAVLVTHPTLGSVVQRVTRPSLA